MPVKRQLVRLKEKKAVVRLTAVSRKRENDRTKTRQNAAPRPILGYGCIGLEEHNQR